jgi:hypothetical protein
VPWQISEDQAPHEATAATGERPKRVEHHIKNALTTEQLAEIGMDAKLSILQSAVLFVGATMPVL